MLSNKFFLIGFGAIYAIIITLAALFFSKKAFYFLIALRNKNKGDSVVKIIALFISTLVWVLVTTIFWNISWRLPIDDSLWNYFSSSHLIVMWFTLVIYFKKNRSGR
ncbi:hypothetical protein [Acinetobacter gyllenbergii]|uniref:hypothetical protein n=1 Tax=Acinetobacter gyllenbergii TaxID=134534 RepID=UPI00241E3580|nr:hypothetical protein [Acinetobacter gyllenbergii]